jgi:pimeloyl-ACP methyl ester carboxylesterase
MAIYDRFAAQIDKKKVRLIIVNMPGWGDAPKFKNIVPTFEVYGQMLGDFIKFLKVKDYSLLGYSAASGIILAALEKQSASPKKVVLISPFGTRSDYLEEWITRFQLNLFLFARRIHFPTFLIKPIMLFVYVVIMMMLPEYRKIKNVKHFLTIASENIRSDFTAITEPVVRSKEYKQGDLKTNGTKFLVIYSKKEMKHYIRKFERFIKMIYAQKHVIEGSDHRHFAFQPELSTPKINEFILNS